MITLFPLFVGQRQLEVPRQESPVVHLRQPSCSRVGVLLIPDEIDVGVFLVRGPMLAEVVEKTVPGLQAVSLEVRDRK